MRDEALGEVRELGLRVSLSALGWIFSMARRTMLPLDCVALVVCGEGSKSGGGPSAAAAITLTGGVLSSAIVGGVLNEVEDVVSPGVVVVVKKEVE